MIFLMVDEAYAFDYLSILEIKKDFSKESFFLWQECIVDLKKQFSEARWSQLLSSKEYANILEANKKTFDAVEKAKNNKVTAQYVDRCNYQRYLAKQNFQKKFFGSVSEVKIGYEKYEPLSH